MRSAGKSVRFLLLALILALIAAAIGAQETEAEEPQGRQSPGEQPPAERSSNPNGLSREEVLTRDVETASFGELVAWADRLGLSTRGSAADLRQRIAGELGIELPTPEPDETQEERQGTRTVVIESADQTRYFTLDDISQDYVRLRGGVTIRLEESDSSATHHITADEVVFNRSKNLLSAQGNVEYLIERDEGDEVFRGESLNFFLDNWEGTFLRGASTRAQTVEGKELEFTYSGEYITRSPGDVVVMENGVITSSQADPPNYHLAARKIWIFGEGEWGLRSAVLHVGRVPVLYFPFFFRPGDELFFHPAIGFRDRVGGYIQTTTYLVGQQEPEDEASISFLQSSETSEDSERVREGLFLTVPDEPRGSPSDDTLKLLTDLYTRLGAYAGLEGSISGGDTLRSLDLSVGFGASRALYRVTGDAPLFTSYRIEDGEGEIHWDTTDFGGLSLPLRYKIDVDSDLSLGNAGLSAEFELYSDPYVNNDFLARQENMRWLEALRGQTDSADSSRATTKNTLLWRLSGDYSLRPEALTPFVDRVSIDRLEASLGWRSRERAVQTLPEHLTNATGTAVVADRNPATRFFYPDNLVLPRLDASMSGTLYSTDQGFRGSDDRPDDQENRDDQDGDRSEEAFRAPWSEPERREPSPEDAKQEDSGNPGEGSPSSDAPLSDADGAGIASLKVPNGILGTLSGISVATPLGVDLTYRLDPELRLDYPYNTDDWTEPSEIDFETRYTTLTTSNDAQLNYRFDILDGIVTVQAGFDASAQYRALSNISDTLSEQQVERERNDARAFSSTELSHNVSVTGYPLRTVARLSDSRLQYRIDNLVFARRLNDAGNYENSWAEWNEEAISRHTLSSTLLVNLWRERQSLSLTTTLPPIDPRVDGSLNLHTGPVNSTLAGSVERPEEERSWQFNPLELRQTATVGEETELSHTTRYGFEEERFESFQSSFGFYALSASYRMSQGRDLEFEPNYESLNLSSPWVEKGNEALRPERLSLELDVDRSTDPFWKNRLTLAGEISSRVNMDLRRFTQSALTFRTSFGVQLHQFLELSFSSTTENSRVYLYVPSLAEQTGRAPLNPIVDLFNSFRFGSREARQRSNFNLQRISFNMLHHLGDWDLTVSYSGRPTQVTDPNTNQPQYEWTPQLELVVEWNPVTELRSEITVSDDELTFVESDT